MVHYLKDSRELMAKQSDIQAFFECHSIVGRIIEDIRPSRHDYMIRNLEDIDDIFSKDADASIHTDGQVCIVFEDGDHIEVEYSGDGPIVLGFNTAKLEEYPLYDGACYSLHTLFRNCLRQTVKDIRIEKSDHRMEFPAYCGIDMSEDDEGVNEIRFILGDDSTLRVAGEIDWFLVEHFREKHVYSTVPFKELLEELNNKTFNDIFEEDNTRLFHNTVNSVRKVEFRYRHEFLDFLAENKDKIIGNCIKGFYNGYGVYDALIDDPLALVFDTFCVVIEYFFWSDITIYIVDRATFEKDPSLEFIYKDVVGLSISFPQEKDEAFPLCGVPIKRVSLSPFTNEFYTNVARDIVRPEGGDYFREIKIELENGQALCICAEDPISDGYCRAWIEGEPG